MIKRLLSTSSALVLVLFLVTACGTGEEEDPVDERLDEEAPMNLDDYNDGEEPTDDESYEDFGEETEEEVEQDIPDNDLEKDQDTESSP